MGLEIRDSTGDLVFSPREIGQSDVTKTEIISEIIKDLLGDITFKMETKVSDDFNAAAYDLYTRPEINKLLESYIKYIELSDKVLGEILVLIDKGTIASGEKISELEKNIENLVKVNETFRTEIDDLSQSVTSHSQSIQKINASLSSINNTLEDINNTKIEDINSDIEDLQNIVGDKSSGLTIRVINLENTVGDSTKGLVKDVADLKYYVSDLKTTIASAITDMGVYTSEDASKDTMAANIRKISTGIDTSDADMVASDLAKGKIGYARGIRIVGTREEVAAANAKVRIINYDSADTWGGANSTLVDYEGSGSAIITSSNIICQNGCSIGYGDVGVVVDGNRSSLDELEGSTIDFNSSIKVEIGDLYTEDGKLNGICPQCEEGVMVVQLGMILAVLSVGD